MFSKTFILASVATLAAAQTATSSASSSTSTGTCGSGQLILDSCMGTIQAQVNSCGTTDYNCLCSAYNGQIGCYASAGCPNDPGVGTAQQLKALNCNNASVYGSTSSTHATSATSTSATGTATTTMATSAASGFASGTSSGSSSSATSSSSSTNGANNVKAAGGLLGIVAAGIAALL